MFKFYFPDESTGRLPDDPSEFAQWFQGLARTSTLLGPAAWTVQTYLYVRQRGLNCELTADWPDEGIVIAHRDHLPDEWAQRPQRYVACCLADRMLPHPCANLHILQNPYQFVRLGAYAYVPHWPQPGLQARGPGRGDRMRSLAFFGEVQNLAPELRGPEFAAWCQQQGLQFTIPPREAWADYRAVDAVIAVRQFSNQWGAFDKPATKLFNAWLAGVVPILGMESAYAAEGQHRRNCCVVPDLAALKALLTELRDDARLLKALLAAGTLAAQARGIAAVTDHWVNLLTQQVEPAARRRLRFGHLLNAPADGWSRLKAGLAWRGHLLHHHNPHTDWPAAPE